tara:strand:- start:1576 stop:1740 length:165 start_codon:yes stop_codon:yes gene_type:complete
MDFALCKDVVCVKNDMPSLVSGKSSSSSKGVDLHLKLTQDLHLKLTHPDGQIMA